MHTGEQYAVGANPAEGHVPAGTGRAARRWWPTLAWAAGAAVLFVLYLRISNLIGPSSDVANNALQSWDMLHGHILLHGWIIGDATYYTFDLPLLALGELFFGLSATAAHVTLAVIYLIVTGCAVAIAVTGSSGAARATRAAVVVAVLAAPALVAFDWWVPLGLPDHTGTTVFLLVSVLLADRRPDWRWTAPLLAVVLAAGQIGDATVRYMTVPAFAIVFASRMMFSRKLRGPDGAILLGTVASVPLAMVVRAVMLHFGSYLMRSPDTRIAPVSRWGKNLSLTAHALRELFGAQTEPGRPGLGAAALYGYGCLLLALAGLLVVVFRWRTARRAEVLLATVIVVNIGEYVISVLPAPASQHDLVSVLVAGAVLAARGVVPARITVRVAAISATVATLAVALLPLSLTASTPSAVSHLTPLAAWLEKHGYSHGLAGYWDASAVTLLTGNRVEIRTVKSFGSRVTPDLWETNTLWFKPTGNYANFLILDRHGPGPSRRAVAATFGAPARTYHLGRWTILSYDKNLIKDVKKAPKIPTS